MFDLKENSTPELNKDEINTNCANYNLDKVIEEKTKKYEAEKGRKKILIIFYFLTGILIFSYAFHHIVTKFSDDNVILSEILIILLQTGLFCAIFNGMNWARITLSILYIVWIFQGLYYITTHIQNHLLNLIGLSQVLIYSLTIYFLYFNKNFKTFFNNKKKKH